MQYHICLLDFDYLAAVSYTHLDVYKRQSVASVDESGLKSFLGHLSFGRSVTSRAWMYNAYGRAVTLKQSS